MTGPDRPAPLPGRVAVMPPGRLSGSVRVPGDKSVSHRALILGSLAEGTSEILGLSDGEDVAATRRALQALGITIEAVPTGPGGAWLVHGGRRFLHPAGGVLDCGNSGTTMRLLAGLAAGLAFTTVLGGDPSISERPMDRVATPLTLMGARVTGTGDRCLPPLEVTGGRLAGIEYAPPMASSQVKSAVLLAGLDADGETVVRERVRTRAHTEEMLAAAGAEITVEPWGEGRTVRVRRSVLRPVDLVIPGDPSQAAFWVVAGCVVPGSEVRIESVYGGPERTGYLSALARMGAEIERTGGGGSVDLVARGSTLRGTEVRASEIPSLDEVPVLAVAAAAAVGRSVFHDVGELRVKESDRLVGVVEMVRLLGAEAAVSGDDLSITGVGPGSLRSGAFSSRGDHRMAMAATIGALAAAGTSTIDGFGCVATSYPTFLEHLSTVAGVRSWVDPPPGTTGGPDRRISVPPHGGGPVT